MFSMKCQVGFSAQRDSSFYATRLQIWHAYILITDCSSRFMPGIFREVSNECLSTLGCRYVFYYTFLSDVHREALPFQFTVDRVTGNPTRVYVRDPSVGFDLPIISGEPSEGSYPRSILTDYIGKPSEGWCARPISWVCFTDYATGNPPRVYAKWLISWM